MYSNKTPSEQQKQSLTDTYEMMGIAAEDGHFSICIEVCFNMTIKNLFQGLNRTLYTGRSSLYSLSLSSVVSNSIPHNDDIKSCHTFTTIIFYIDFFYSCLSHEACLDCGIL